MTVVGWTNVIWIFAAAALGFLTAAYFAGRLRLHRQLFLIPYVLLSVVLFAAYLSWSGTDTQELFEDNLLWGIVAATIISVFLVFTVIRQPSSPRPNGSRFAIDIAWSGVVYGSVDGFLLGALPVMAIKNAIQGLDWGSDTGTSIVTWVLAIAASAFVTVAYHAGYPEFRNRSILLPVIALAIGSIGYLSTGNPVAVIGSHAVMHIAAVIHGTEKTVQLPPHYPDPVRTGQ